MSDSIAINCSSRSESSTTWTFLLNLIRTINVDLKPSKYRPYGPYSILFHAKVGDHVVVRSSKHGVTNVTWHHAIFVGGDQLIYMENKTHDISKLSYDAFVKDLISDGNQVDAAGVIEYEGDNDLLRSHSAVIAHWATIDMDIKEMEYYELDTSCWSFPTFCRTGRHIACTHLPVLDKVSILGFTYKT